MSQLAGVDLAHLKDDLDFNRHTIDHDFIQSLPEELFGVIRNPGAYRLFLLSDQSLVQQLGWAAGEDVQALDL